MDTENDGYPELEDVWIDPESILNRTWVLLNDLTINPDTRLYFYSALELRFFIESLYLTMLVEFKSNIIEKKDLKIYRPKDFDRVLIDIDTNYFNEANKKFGWSLSRKNINSMNEIYGILGVILHLPKEPFFMQSHNNWKIDTESTILDAFKNLSNLIGYKHP